MFKIGDIIFKKNLYLLLDIVIIYKCESWKKEIMILELISF